MILVTGNKTCGNNNSNKQFAQLIKSCKTFLLASANKNIAAQLFYAALLDPYCESVTGHWF